MILDSSTHIYAKSRNNGGTLLIDHLHHVADVAEQIAEALDFDKRIARLGGLLHDIGKAHPEFQKRLLVNNRINFGIPVRHELASLLLLPLFSRGDWDALIDMIAAHHRSIRQDSRGQGLLDLEEREGKEELFGCLTESWPEWSAVAIAILSELGVPVRPVTIEEASEAFNYAIDYCSNKPLNWSKWKGLLVGADHFASALDGRIEDHLPYIFRSPDLAVFDNRINGLYPLSQISSKDIRRHTLVIAPTGAGKTDFLMRRCRNRVFYTLPFQASINAMYRRFKQQMPFQNEIRLLHASSRLVVDGNYSYEEKVLQDKIGASIKVLTPHQLASLICGTRGFEALAIDIMGNDVILDEIHSYSDVSQAMVLEIIKALLKLQCRIHVGSATMPSVLKKRIFKLLGGKKNTYTVSLPLRAIDTFDRHIIHKCSAFEQTLPVIKQALNSNQKILIVCNKVDSAQQRYKYCKESFPDIPIMLLHSRFRRNDRASLENVLKNEFDNSANACIAVSTQVVEVSLDISFDIMITDCAPIDSLIQRFGRINRRRTLENVQSKIFKPVYIIEPPDDNRKCLPYKLPVLRKSFDILPDNEVLHERDLQKKIDHVFPVLDLVPIDSHLVWDKNEFLLTELCHYPSSVLMETLNIDSASAVCAADLEQYEKGNSEDRISLEIPIPRGSLFRNFSNCGYSKHGTCPAIIPDNLYSTELGLEWKEINTFL